MKRLVLAFLVFVGGGAKAETSASRLWADLQQKDFVKTAPYPVLLIDRDDLEWRFVAAHATGDARKREQIIRDYVREKTGVLITENAAANFEPYLTVLKEAATAMPAMTDDFSTIQVCVVFPFDPNRNQRLEIERLLQLQTAEAYGDRTYDQLRPRMSYEDSVLFSMLHEIGHCLDRTYFPRIARGDSDPYTIHQGEAFAETLGALLMVKEGREEVIDARIALRSVYTYFMEPFFVRHPQNGLGSESYVYGGLIYYLAPVLRGVAGDIRSGVEDLRKRSIAEILDRALEIVAEKDVDGRTFTAIYASYAEGAKSRR